MGVEDQVTGDSKRNDSPDSPLGTTQAHHNLDCSTIFKGDSQWKDVI